MNPLLDKSAIGTAHANAAAALLSRRNVSGYWEGRLASSALSTATAAFALRLYQQAAPDNADDERLDQSRKLSAKGLEWLAAHQNGDGGWGDTTLSLSNISTTALCWAALAADGETRGQNIQSADAYLTKAARSTEPADFARAIADRYGEDRTFSVPILTMCALAGRLGDGSSAWRLVPQLPFELAACPQSWFRWLRLGVVSYALPALIAMGRARHHHRPTWNPISRVLRRLSLNRTMTVLRQIQPEGGGFLEATPLTAFVCMSLISVGLADSDVVRDGIGFLVDSARDDGSWPIDTNLATWVTTLSINALTGKDQPAMLDDGERKRILDWLLVQQHRQEHPYTRAAPGGWAWTDLRGGVPDADDTAGALVALHTIGGQDGEVMEAAAAGCAWLADLQNADGGIPTFCRGWGKLPFDRGGADLTAHAIAAWTLWKNRLPAELQPRISAALSAGMAYLLASQRHDGTWAPLWFGNERSKDQANLVYGTARVLMVLERLDLRQFPNLAGMRRKASDWLLSHQSADGSWGGAKDAPGSIEETSLAVQALCGVSGHPPRIATALAGGAKWLIERTQNGKEFPPAPIGFYFASLWYYEELYPLIFAVGALSRLRNAQTGTADDNTHTGGRR